MPLDQLFVCFLVLACVVMFIWEKISPDIVSIAVLFLLLVVPFEGHPILVPSSKAEQATILGNIFGNNAILTVIFMFIVGAAVDRTGLVEVLGRAFEKIAGQGGRRTLMVLGLLTIPVSAFLNNTTVVVVFVPMILGLCRQAQLVPSRFLIPLSYFAIVGGMCTLIGTSTNLLVKGIVESHGLDPLSMFEITPLGIVLSAASLIFIILFSQKLLPDRVSLATLIDTESSGEFLLAAIVGEQSPLVQKPISEGPLARNKKLRLIEVRRSGNRVDTPLNQLHLEAGDRVIIKCRLSGRNAGGTDALVENVKSELGLTFVHLEKAMLMEVMIGPHSNLVGNSLAEISFRQQYGVVIVALHREGVNQRENFQSLKLEVGDTLLLEGSRERMNELFTHRDFINLTEVSKQRRKTTAVPNPHAVVAKKPRTHRSWVALLALAGVVVLGATPLPFEWVAMGAALLVVSGGCLSKDEIYDAVDWRIVTMILGTLGLGIAMDRTGAAKTIVNGLMSVIQNWDKRIIVSALLLFTIILTELLSNNAVAALLTPLAIQLAQQLHCEPRPFIIAVMAGASIGFAIPAGYQTHMLVYSAGGYKFSDFFRIGISMDILCWIVGSITIPLIWPV